MPPQAAQGAHAANERRKTNEQLKLQVRGALRALLSQPAPTDRQS
jgi:hypothetical protein